MIAKSLLRILQMAALGITIGAVARAIHSVGDEPSDGQPSEMDVSDQVVADQPPSSPAPSGRGDYCPGCGLG